MKRIAILISTLLLYGCPSYAKGYIHINTDVVQKSIVFLYAAHQNGDLDSRHPLGTGFLVRVGPPKSPHLLLITARHIVEPQWALCSSPNPEVLFARLNSNTFDPKRESSGVFYAKIPLRSAQGREFYVSDDELVDAAVIPVPLEQFHDKDQWQGPITSISLAEFATEEELKTLEIGISIVSAGLVVDYLSDKRNYPIFKFGQISNIVDEPMWLSCEPGKPALKSVKVWLIAANLIPGNSGSPIFSLSSGSLGVSFGGMRTALIGVQSGSLVLADVAMMTPINYVTDIVTKHFPDATLK